MDVKVHNRSRDGKEGGRGSRTGEEFVMLWASGSVKYDQSDFSGFVEETMGVHTHRPERGMGA